MNAHIEGLAQWLARERPELVPAGDAPAAPVEGTPDALRAWWAWADRVAQAAPAGEAGCLLRHWRLLDRATSAARQAEWNRRMAECVEFEGWWRSAWVPIAERLDGDLLVVDLEGTFDVAGAIVEVLHDAPFRYVRAEGLDAWLGGLVRSLEAGDWLQAEEGSWWDDRDAQAWELFGASGSDEATSRFPYCVELNQERKAPETPRGTWSEAWVRAVAETAQEARWARLPHAWGALRCRAGGDLDETLARLDEAPTPRRAEELAHLVTDLTIAGDARAEAPTATLLALPAAALVSAVVALDLSHPALRARLATRAIDQAAARAEGAAALCAALAAAVASHDPAAARLLRWWAGRLRPTPDTRVTAAVMQALAAARAGDPDAAARVGARLGEACLLRDGDVSTHGALVAACLAVGRWPDALAERWRWPCPEALAAVRTLCALGARDEARRVLDAATGDWRAALLVAFAAALPVDDRAGADALAEAEGLVPNLRELFWTVGDERKDMAREQRFDHATTLLRKGLRAEALEALDAWWRGGRGEVAAAAEQLRAQLDDPSARPEAPWRAPTAEAFDSLAASWRPAQLRQESTQRLLRWAVALADGDAAPRGRAVVEAIEAAMRASGPPPWRYEDTLALALAAHGRADDALAIARGDLWFSTPRVLVALVARLVAMGRRDDALTLGQHLVRGRPYDDVLAVAAAVALVCPTSLPRLRATCDALGAEGASPAAT